MSFNRFPKEVQRLTLKNPRLERRLFCRRAWLALLLVVLGLSIVVGRLVYLQVLRHDHFAALADKNRVKLLPLAPVRGRIFDRNGILLATHRLSAYPTRHYPLGSSAAHVIGYVENMTAHARRYSTNFPYPGNRYEGKVGVERAYEKLLQGQPGYQRVEVDARGRSVRMLDQRLPVPGQDLYLTLDMRLQRVAEQALTGHIGAIVAIDPGNGQILAMASAPGYDPNLFIEGIDFQTFEALRAAPDRPLFNRALQGMYPPASTLKPLLGFAGLEHTVIAANDRVRCRGYYHLPGHARVFRDWKRQGHGRVDLDRAIAQSCDVYFYDLALKLGIDDLHAQLSRFGLGRPTGIDLGGEKPGLLPSPAWKEATYQQGWHTGETLLAGIGQGYMLVTPLQLAQAMAILGQRGQGYRPHLLYATQAPGDTQWQRQAPTPLAPINAHDPRHWDAVLTAMIHGVHEARGTAWKIGKDASYTIAGKTGTAQLVSLPPEEGYMPVQLTREIRDHALFVAIAPADDPQIAMAVVVENGGSGGAVAAPLARQVLDAYLLGSR